MIIIALIMSVIVSVLAGIVVFKYINSTEELYSEPIKEVSVESERAMLIESLREINKKLREQIYETETLNALLIQKSELEKKLDKITSVSVEVDKKSPIQPNTQVNMPIQPR